MPSKPSERPQASDTGEQSPRYEVHLRDYLSIVYKRLSVIIVTLVLVFVFVALPEAQKPRMYRTSASLLIKPPRLNFMSTEGITYYLMSKQDFDTQLYLMKSKKVALEVMEAIVREPKNRDLLHELGHPAAETPSDAQLDALANNFRGRLEISAMKDTNVVNLTLRGREPALIYRLLDLYCECYREYNGERDREHLEESQRQLAKLIPDLQRNVDNKVQDKQQLINTTPYSQHGLAVEKEQLERLGSELIDQGARLRDVRVELGQLVEVLLQLPPVRRDARIAGAEEAIAEAKREDERQAALRTQADEFGHGLMELLDGVRGEGLVVRQAYRNAAAGLSSFADQGGTRAHRGRGHFERIREQAEQLLIDEAQKPIEHARKARDAQPTGDGFLVLTLTRPEILAARVGADGAASGETVAAVLARRDRAAEQLSSAHASSQAEFERLRAAAALAEKELDAAVSEVVTELVARRRALSAQAEARSPAELAQARRDAERGLYTVVEQVVRDSSKEILDDHLDRLMTVAEVLADEALTRLAAELQEAELGLRAATNDARRQMLAPDSANWKALVEEPQDLVQQRRVAIIDHVLRGLRTRTLLAKSVEENLEDIERQLASHIALVGFIELTQAEFDRVEFKIDTAENLLSSAIKEQQRVEFDAKLRENNVSRVEYPRQPSDWEFYEPDIQRSILLGIVFGLVAGFGLAFVLEYLDDTIKTASDIDRYLAAPILGAIPTMVGKAAERRDLISYYEPKASISEAFRSVRTSLLFTSSDTRRDTFVVTSVGPQEGKTTISVNLAITLAQAGSRTLLVDCDLRRPRVHKAFGIQENLGLTNIIVGGGKVQDFARDTEIPNLQVLTSGPIPPNPSELVGSKAMRAFFEELRGKYDKIIYDTPPLAAVTDGVILGGMVDGLVLVISSAKTTKKLAQRAREQLDNVGVPIFGVVLNNVKASHGYYYYSSYYRYYGEESTKSSG